MTTQTMTLTDFLLARIAEDESAALVASNAPWTALTMFPTRSEVTNETEIDGGVIVRTPRKDDYDATHIARHDPARVLAECQAKREIVKIVQEKRGTWMTPVCAFDILHALALPYANHPERRVEWGS